MVDISSQRLSKPAPIPESIVPGLVLVGVVTIAAFALTGLPLLGVMSPMILAILIGMAVHNLVGSPAIARPGIGLAGKRLLRVAVALLGLQLTFADIGGIGAAGIFILVASVISTFAFTLWLGRLMGVPRPLCELLAAGTSICGASAIAATNSVTRAAEEDVSYAVACVTLFGTAAMFLFPLVALALSLDPGAAGLWIGASVHEVAQVVGAAFQAGPAAGEAGVVAKLARVLMLAPVILIVGHLALRSSRRAPVGAKGAEDEGRPPLVPVFILAFLALTTANSFGLVPPMVQTSLTQATPVLLTAALAALGLGTDMRKLKARGLRPLLLAASASLFVAVFALLLVMVLV